MVGWRRSPERRHARRRGGFAAYEAERGTNGAWVTIAASAVAADYGLAPERDRYDGSVRFDVPDGDLSDGYYTLGEADGLVLTVR